MTCSTVVRFIANLVHFGSIPGMKNYQTNSWVDDKSYTGHNLIDNVDLSEVQYTATHSAWYLLLDITPISMVISQKAKVFLDIFIIPF